MLMRYLMQRRIEYQLYGISKPLLTFSLRFFHENNVSHDKRRYYFFDDEQSIIDECEEIFTDSIHIKSPKLREANTVRLG